MIRTIAVAATAWLALATAASAAQTALPTLSAPPVGVDPASAGYRSSETIFDALMAISRATLTDAPAAQRASIPYATAIQQFNTGDFSAAQQSALAAIADTAAPLQPPPNNVPPAVSPQPPAYMREVLSVSQSEMEERLGLARRAMSSCGPQTGSAYAAAMPLYTDAVNNEIAQRALPLDRDVQKIVDGCAVAPLVGPADGGGPSRLQAPTMPATAPKPN